MDTLIIELKHRNALQLLKDLEALDIIALHENVHSSNENLSEKYRGVLSKEGGLDLMRHVEQMRDEWSNI